MKELSPQGSLPILKPGYIRQIIDFSPSTAKTLRELAKGGSIGDTLRDAIALSKWFKDTREKGGRILVERNGKVYEVIELLPIRWQFGPTHGSQAQRRIIPHRPF